MSNGFWQFLVWSDGFKFGSEGDDLIFGSAGRDNIYGLAGNDFIFGGRGSDNLHGGAGNDWLLGGRGRDVLRDGAGDDVLFGGRGRDQFIYSTAENTESRDVFFGGSGRDQLVLTTGGTLSTQLLNDVTLFEAQMLSGHHKKSFSFSHTNLKIHSIEQLIIEIATPTTLPIELLEDAAVPVVQQLNAQFADVMTDVVDVRSEQLSFQQGLDGYHVELTFENTPIADLLVSADGTVTLTPLAGEIDALSAEDVVQATFTTTFQTEFGTQFWVHSSVQVIGQNDVPFFHSGDTSVTLSDAMQGTASGQFSFVDPDRNDSHEVQVFADGMGYLGTLNVTLAPADKSVSWSFTLSPDELANVSSIDEALQTYSVAVSDSQGAFFEQTITVDLTDIVVQQPLEAEVPIDRAIVEQIVLPEPVAAPGGAVFSVAVSNGNAVIAVNSITVPEGSQVLNLPIKGDMVGAAVVTVTGSYATASGNVISFNETVDVQVVDTAEPLVVSALSTQVVESEDQAFVNVSLNQEANTDVTVAFEILDGTAGVGRDFLLPIVMSVTIPANTSAAQIAIPLLDDQLPEGTESLFLRITNAFDQNGAVSFDPNPALVEILEDDKLLVSADEPFTIAQGLLAEVSVNLENPVDPGGQLFNVSTSGSDGLVAPSTIFVSDGEDYFTFDLSTNPKADAGIATLIITDSGGNIINSTAVTISNEPLMYDPPDDPQVSSLVADDYLFV